MPEERQEVLGEVDRRRQPLPATGARHRDDPHGHDDAREARGRLHLTDVTKWVNHVTVVIWDRDFQDGELAEEEIAFWAQDDQGVMSGPSSTVHDAADMLRRICEDHEERVMAGPEADGVAPRELVELAGMVDCAVRCGEWEQATRQATRLLEVLSGHYRAMRPLRLRCAPHVGAALADDALGLICDVEHVVITGTDRQRRDSGADLSGALPPLRHGVERLLGHEAAEMAMLRPHAKAQEPVRRRNRRHAMQSPVNHLGEVLLEHSEDEETSDESGHREPVGGEDP